MAEEYLRVPMGIVIRENVRIVKGKVQEQDMRRTGTVTMEISRRTKCTGKEYTYIAMGTIIKESTARAKDTGRERCIMRTEMLKK